ncbi:MAG TPA: NfeD family protein [Tepidisphaeraceae bacterium]|jgi:membrane-bound serine protease (ClpP class)|nr:NfeD family protein [Tepidisphaeraceae bacterium]
MNVAFFIFVMLAAALVLTALELALPSHGLLGVLASACLLVAIGACFWINQWLGVGALLFTLAITPLLWSAFVKYWPRSPVGRHMVLQPVDASVARPRVAVGQAGIAVSELRPTGTAEFDGQRLEVASEFGIITAATKVRVVSIENNRPIVVAV